MLSRLHEDNDRDGDVRITIMINSYELNIILYWWYLTYFSDRSRSNVTDFLSYAFEYDYDWLYTLSASSQGVCDFVSI